MKIHVWGTDFRRSTSEMRAKLACPASEKQAKVAKLLSLGFSDIVYLATCNRVEFYTTAKDHFQDTRELWLGLLKEFGLEEEDYYRGYHFEGKSAVRHLMRVASSLESLVIGEPQILGQLKDALAWTKDNGLPVDSSLDRSFKLAFETAKKVRSNTAIGEKPVSVATLGLQHLVENENIYPLERAVVVGRGPISVIAIQWLKKNRPNAPVLWVNRSLDNLAAMPEAQGIELQSLSDFLRQPPRFSHLITATSSLEPVFSHGFFERTGGPRKMVLDFAQPPDVERTERTASLIDLLHLEDLKEVARANSSFRQKAIEEAAILIDQALREYCREQKEAPVLRDFNAIEPRFLEELANAVAIMEKEFPTEIHPKIRKWAEKLVKKNLHSSREHLRLVLRKVSDPEKEGKPEFL